MHFGCSDAAFVAEQQQALTENLLAVGRPKSKGFPSLYILNRDHNVGYGNSTCICLSL
jgi:hypothetical protein